MVEEIQIETPEAIRLTLYPAGLGSRFFAYCVDSLILFGVFILFAFLFFYGLRVLGEKGFPWFAAVMGIGFFLFRTLYFFFYEWLREGQTPGKKIARVRVVREGGLPMSGAAALIRTLFRVLDDWPLFWVVPLISKTHKRLGDFAAGTWVISVRTEKWQAVFPAESYSRLPEHRFILGPEILKRITSGEMAMLETYFLRAPRLPAEARDDLQRQVAAHFEARLDVAVPAGRKEIFLKELYLFLREERQKNALL